jgi:thiamine biosynthesis protein ThiI
LKGKNRRDFVARLKDNIVLSAKVHGVSVQIGAPVGARLRYTMTGDEAQIVKSLQCVMGIAQFGFVTSIQRDIAQLESHVREALSKIKESGESLVRFDTRRADKSFELTSPEINAKLGAIAKELDLKVDYKNAIQTISTLIERDAIYVVGEFVSGIGGLPVGTGGRVLMLLSGGFDSPVAAWELMRRGCRVDYLHIHSLRDNDEVEKSKIAQIVRTLNNYGLRARLWVVPYLPFDLAVSGAVPPGVEVVVFKNFMHKLAAQIAQNEGYDAIANGDNLAQVASQTIHNMRAGGSDVDFLLLRPLLTSLKQDIITRASEIGTYDDRVAEYKDCCSLVAKNPKTRVNYDKFTKVIEGFPMDEVIAQSIAQMSKYDISL